MDIRLDTFLARAGVASRRTSKELIEFGQVKVNDDVVTVPGARIETDRDKVTISGKVLSLPTDNTTLMFHKQAGVVTTASDSHKRRTVYDFIPIDKFPSLFNVGRLDLDTTGLLLFTTDGKLGNRLMHPRYHIEKRYIAFVEGTLDEKGLYRLRNGIKLDDGITLPAKIDILEGEEAKKAASLIGSDKNSSGYKYRRRLEELPKGAYNYVSIGLKEGRKRQIRRMFEAVGVLVISLHRESYGPLELGNLGRATWRFLTADEIDALHAAVDDEDGEKPLSDDIDQ